MSWVGQQSTIITHPATKGSERASRNHFLPILGKPTAGGKKLEWFDISGWGWYVRDWKHRNQIVILEITCKKWYQGWTEHENCHSKVQLITVQGLEVVINNYSEHSRKVIQPQTTQMFSLLPCNSSFLIMIMMMITKTTPILCSPTFLKMIPHLMFPFLPSNPSFFNLRPCCRRPGDHISQGKSSECCWRVWYLTCTPYQWPLLNINWYDNDDVTSKCSN